MVGGLDVFIEHFEAYTDHYVLIGGSACDWQMEQKGLPFRATKDIEEIISFDNNHESWCAIPCVQKFMPPILFQGIRGVSLLFSGIEFYKLPGTPFFSSLFECSFCFYYFLKKLKGS